MSSNISLLGNITTDVLVIGGGGAGMRAAIEARRHGVDVTIVSSSHAGYGSNTAALKVSGPGGTITKSKTVAVSPGAAKKVSFTVTESVPGTYQVSLAGSSGQFIVISTGALGTGGGLGTGGMIAIAVIIIVLIIGLVLIFRRV